MEMIFAVISFTRRDLATVYSTLDDLAPGWGLESSPGQMKSLEATLRIREQNLKFVEESISQGRGDLPNFLRVVLPSKESATLVKLSFDRVKISGID